MGSTPPGSADTQNSTGVQWIFFCSFFFWLLYSSLMFYLYYEHKSRNQYPQHFIVLLLAAGALFRCIWFALVIFTAAANTVGVQFVNRVAILLQFSAISLLLLMWSRALNVSAAIDKKAFARMFRDRSKRSPAVSSPRQGSDKRADGEEDTEGSMRHSISEIMDAQRSPNVGRHSTSPGHNTAAPKRQSSSASVSQGGNVDLRNHLVQKRLLWIAVNVVAWLLILSTILVGSERAYNINIIALSALCLFVALAMLSIGLMNWNRLRQELSTVYTSGAIQRSGPVRAGARSTSSSGIFSLFSATMHSRLTAGSRDGSGLLKANIENSDGGAAAVGFPCSCSRGGSWCCSAIECIADSWNSLFSGGRYAGGRDVRLRIQTEVLRTVLVVSVVVSLLFALRCYAFMYRPVVENYFGVHDSWLSAYYYPWLFYQLPEFVPSLVVARGISPPKGILRQSGNQLTRHFNHLWGKVCLLCCFAGSMKAGRQDSAQRNQRSNQRAGVAAEGASEDGNDDESFGYNPNRARQDSDLDLDLENPAFRGSAQLSPKTEQQFTLKIPARSDGEAISDDLSSYIYTISSFESSMNFARTNTDSTAASDGTVEIPSARSSRVDRDATDENAEDDNDRNRIANLDLY